MKKPALIGAVAIIGVGVAGYAYADYKLRTVTEAWIAAANAFYAAQGDGPIQYDSVERDVLSLSATVRGLRVSGVLKDPRLDLPYEAVSDEVVARYRLDGRYDFSVQGIAFTFGEGTWKGEARDLAIKPQITGYDVAEVRVLGIDPKKITDFQAFFAMAGWHERYEATGVSIGMRFSEDDAPVVTTLGRLWSEGLPDGGLTLALEELTNPYVTMASVRMELEDSPVLYMPPPGVVNPASGETVDEDVQAQAVMEWVGEFQKALRDVRFGGLSIRDRDGAEIATLKELAFADMTWSGALMTGLTLSIEELAVPQKEDWPEDAVRLVEALKLERPSASLHMEYRYAKEEGVMEIAPLRLSVNDVVEGEVTARVNNMHLPDMSIFDGEGVREGVTRAYITATMMAIPQGMDVVLKDLGGKKDLLAFAATEMQMTPEELGLLVAQQAALQSAMLWGLDIEAQAFEHLPAFLRNKEQLKVSLTPRKEGVALLTMADLPIGEAWAVTLESQ